MMCILKAPFFTRNDSRVSKSRTRQYPERAICTASPDWAGAFAAKRICFGSCTCACRCVHSPRGDSPKRSLHLRRIRRLWLDSWGGGVKQKSDSGRGQACSKFQHDGGLPNLLYLLGISESKITSLSDPRGDHAFSRALLSAGLELPCDAARLLFRSSTKRGERRGGIASGPAVAAGLLLVGGEPGSGLPPTFVEVCRVRHGPLLLGICRGLRCR